MAVKTCAVRLVKVSAEAHDYLELLKIFYWPDKSYADIIDLLIEQVEKGEHYKEHLVEF